MLAIVSHDAGGAEILSSWVVQHHGPYCLVVDGPAKAIFEHKLVNIENISLKSAIAQSDWVLTGTSWKSELELKAIKLARANGIKAVSFLDHWANYPHRFTRNGYLLLPDEIWVGDEAAFLIAMEDFPDVPIILLLNPYFEDLKKKIEILKNKTGPDISEFYILYVCSPNSLGEFGVKYEDSTDKDAIRYFMDNLHVINPEGKRVILRPHPTESIGKYDWTLREFGSDIQIGGVKSLLEEIINADVIVGCNSMAMVVGLIAGKRVISGIPPNRKIFNLPMPEIKHLHQLIEEYQR